TAFLSSVAPHLVRPMPLVLAMRDTGRCEQALLGGVLGVYRTLAGSGGRTARMLEARDASRLVPLLRLDRAGACALLPEAQTNDARLSLATVKAAAASSAVVSNYVRI